MTTAIAMTGSRVVLVDSSAWLEFIAGDEKAEAFGAYLHGDFQVVVPTIVLYEVVKILLLRAGPSDADLFLSEALQCRVADLTETIALAAASRSIAHRLPQADAIIYATARAHQAQLISSNAQFTGVPGVTIL